MAQRDRLKRRLDRATVAWIEAKRTGEGYWEAKRELREARQAWRKVRPVEGVQPATIGIKTEVR